MLCARCVPVLTNADVGLRASACVILVDHFFTASWAQGQDMEGHSGLLRAALPLHQPGLLHVHHE